MRFDLFSEQGTTDSTIGKRFFIGLLLSLLFLIVAYIVLHLIFPERQGTLSEALVDMIESTEGTVVELSDLRDDGNLNTMLENINTSVEETLEQNQGLNAEYTEQISTLLENITNSVDNNNKELVLAYLSTLKRLVESPAAPSFSLWSNEPLRFLEVLFWAFTGVLVKKITESGYYLRRNTFYKEGIWMHVAQLAASPLVVLVAVLLLSLFSISLTLSGGSVIQLDLDDPRIMVAVAFLLGSTPWSIWNGLQGFANNITGRLTGN